MELRTINTFLHIAELHSFSRAARELGYSQSAVSAQVAQLEAELETPLFDRVGKTVRLTDAGQTFLTYARSLLATAEQAKAALQPARQVSGTLRVALADSVCSTFLPDLLQRYHALCPQVELVLRTATDDEMLQMLGSNQIDLAYTLDKPLLQPSFVLAVDEPEPICVVAPAGHPLAGQAEVTLQELAGQEFLLTERGMSYRDALDQCMAAQGLAIKPFLELGSASLLCQMVEHGMGLSFLPEYIVQNALAAGTLARLNVPACRVEMRRQHHALSQRHARTGHGDVDREGAAFGARKSERAHRTRCGAESSAARGACEVSKSPLQQSGKRRAAHFESERQRRQGDGFSAGAGKK